MNKITQTQTDICVVCDEIKELLLAKNRKYGDSALNPVRVFSKASPLEQIKVRLDDKISRLQSAQNDEDEDVITDLIGYLILLKIVISREKENLDTTKQMYGDLCLEAM
jgi:hypothetical protein